MSGRLPTPASPSATNRRDEELSQEVRRGPTDEELPLEVLLLPVLLEKFFD